VLLDATHTMNVADAALVAAFHAGGNLMAFRRTVKSNLRLFEALLPRPCSVPMTRFVTATEVKPCYSSENGSGRVASKLMGSGYFAAVQPVGDLVGVITPLPTHPVSWNTPRTSPFPQRHWMYVDQFA